ncbi:MAG: hypothetical protein K8M05_33730, partial [Deltaproteobacteria bacterium]|nr:hypothetical protein [Kofleriaceae bacterium]
GALYAFRRHPRGAGMSARMRRFAEVADAYFAESYAGERVPPSDLVHVTCTGYESPSAAQRLVAARAWPTRVVHAYHMGCYAALPAVRLGEGLLLRDPDRAARVDIAHTELCSLHLDASAHDLEQLVVQSLFADGFIRYSLRRDGGRGLRLLAMHEVIAPESADAMTWIPGEAGMRMTLSRDVPERIAGLLPAFAEELLGRGGLGPRDAAACVFAVHPGGPKIIDRVRDALELAEAQVGASRGVLRERGNMSSATLPHIWRRILADPAVAPGTKVASLAFGPGLTICGALFEKTC